MRVLNASSGCTGRRRSCSCSLSARHASLTVRRAVHASNASHRASGASTSRSWSHSPPLASHFPSASSPHISLQNTIAPFSCPCECEAEIDLFVGEGSFCPSLDELIDSDSILGEGTGSELLWHNWDQNKTKSSVAGSNLETFKYYIQMLFKMSFPFYSGIIACALKRV